MDLKDLIKIRQLKKILEKYKDESSFKRTIIYSVLLIAATIVTLMFFLFVWVLIIAITLPNVNDLEKFAASQASHIYAKDGSSLYTIHGEEKRTSIEFEEIPPSLINATLAIEDDQFYEHHGIDIPAIMKAIVSELTGQKKRGGSTITQQYIKNTFLNSERKYSRKLREILMALKVEQFFTKDEILKLYFNRISYGNNAYGVEEASKTYFAKKTKDLSLAQSIMLAALPKAPSYYSPYAEHLYPKLDHVFTEEEIKNRNINKHLDLNEDEFWNGLIGTTVNLDSEGKYKIYLNGRTDIVLNRMLELGYIDQATKETTLTELQNLKFERLNEDIKAPHFVLWIKEQVEAKYGKELVERGGLKIYTTLDPLLQEKAEQIIKDRQEFNITNYGATDAALLSMNPKTGEIVTMVGSTDFGNDEIQGKVNMTLSYTPMGSSFKPFVYAKGFLDHGLSPATVLYDVATDFGDGNYPKNYDGTFRGPMSIREALGQSRNIPAIKAYFLSGEQTEILPFTQSLGMEYQEPNIEHGSSLALGPTGIKFISAVEAYSVFANAGIHVEPYAIIKIESFDGTILEEHKEDKGKQVLDPQIAYLITDILSDSSVRLGPGISLTGRANAAKTGTSTKRDPQNDEIRLPKDLLVFGYTPNIVTGVWVGNADGSALKGAADGYNTSAPIWKQFMEFALTDTPVESFAIPAGITQVTVSRATGLLPSENTPEDMLKTEKFASFAIPKTAESPDLFKKIKYDTLSKSIATEFCPEALIEEKVVRQYHDLFPEFWRWEQAVQNWAAGLETEFTNEECKLHDATSSKLKPVIQIISPVSFGEITAGTWIDIEILINGGFSIDNVKFYMNDILRGEVTESPYHGRIFVRPDFADGEEVILKVLATDSLQYQGEAKIKLKISKKDLEIPLD